MRCVRETSKSSSHHRDFAVKNLRKKTTFAKIVVQGPHMPIQPVPEMMQAAQAGRYAVGYFESWNLESLQGVLDAAEQTRSPIIIGVNGDFLSRESRLMPERLPLYGALLRAATEQATVPCGVIFNECPNDEWVAKATGCGFNLVMPADPSAEPAAYRERVKKLVSIAHSRDVAVEAELGELPCGASGDIEERGHPTDPGEAARFVEATGVDLLAVSVGNVHIQVHGESPLNLERLSAIRRKVNVPLVLHGGTGIDADSLRSAIQLGAVKINYGTYLKQRYLTAVRTALSRNVTNPHELLGIGGDDDVLTAGRRAVRDAVLERLPLLGCAGRA